MNNNPNEKPKKKISEMTSDEIYSISPEELFKMSMAETAESAPAPTPTPTPTPTSKGPGIVNSVLNMFKGKPKAAPAPAIQPNSIPNSIFRKGSIGEPVRAIQQALGIEDDGIFGPKTQNAVMDFQAKNGLKVDGIVGPQTLKSLLPTISPVRTQNTPIPGMGQMDKFINTLPTPQAKQGYERAQDKPNLGNFTLPAPAVGGYQRAQDIPERKVDFQKVADSFKTPTINSYERAQDYPNRKVDQKKVLESINPPTPILTGMPGRVQDYPNGMPRRETNVAPVQDFTNMISNVLDTTKQSFGLGMQDTKVGLAKSAELIGKGVTHNERMGGYAVDNAMNKNIAPIKSFDEYNRNIYNSIDQWANKTIAPIEQDIKRREAELGELKGLRGIYANAVRSLPTTAAGMITGAINPALGAATFGTIAGGGYARQAELEGANEDEQALYGIVGGVGEGLSEMIAFDKFLRYAKDTAAGNLMKQGAVNLLKRIMDMGGTEAIQEMAMEPYANLAKKIIYDRNMPAEDILQASKIFESGATGFMMGLIMSALGLPVNAVSRRAVENKIARGEDPATIDQNMLEQAYEADIANMSGGASAQTQNITTPNIESPEYKLAVEMLKKGQDVPDNIRAKYPMLNQLYPKVVPTTAINVQPEAPQPVIEPIEEVIPEETAEESNIEIPDIIYSTTPETYRNTWYENYNKAQAISKEYEQQILELERAKKKAAPKQQREIAKQISELKEKAAFESEAAYDEFNKIYKNLGLAVERKLKELNLSKDETSELREFIYDAFTSEDINENLVDLQQRSLGEIIETLANEYTESKAEDVPAPKAQPKQTKEKPSGYRPFEADNDPIGTVIYGKYGKATKDERGWQIQIENMFVNRRHKGDAQYYIDNKKPIDPDISYFDVDPSELSTPELHRAIEHMDNARMNLYNDNPKFQEKYLDLSEEEDRRIRAIIDSTPRNEFIDEMIKYYYNKPYFTEKGIEAVTKAGNRRALINFLKKQGTAATLYKENLKMYLAFSTNKEFVMSTDYGVDRPAIRIPIENIADYLLGNKEAAYKNVTLIEDKKYERPAPWKAADTKEEIAGLKHTEKEIIDFVREHINYLTAENELEGLDFEIINIEVVGSRTTGTNREDSDLDIKLYYEGEAREDDLFNALNGDNALEIDDITVDINPIKKVEEVAASPKGEKVTLKNFGEVEIVGREKGVVILRNKNGSEIKLGETAFNNLLQETSQPLPKAPESSTTDDNEKVVVEYYDGTKHDITDLLKLTPEDFAKMDDETLEEKWEEAGEVFQNTKVGRDNTIWDITEYGRKETIKREIKKASKITDEELKEHFIANLFNNVDGYTPSYNREHYRNLLNSEKMTKEQKAEILKKDFGTKARYLKDKETFKDTVGAYHGYGNKPDKANPKGITVERYTGGSNMYTPVSVISWPDFVDLMAEYLNRSEKPKEESTAVREIKIDGKVVKEGQIYKVKKDYYEILGISENDFITAVQDNGVEALYSKDGLADIIRKGLLVDRRALKADPKGKEIMSKIVEDIKREFESHKWAEEQAEKDPNWKKGKGPDLIRNHIIFDKRHMEIVSKMFGLELPKEYHIPTPDDLYFEPEKKELTDTEQYKKLLEERKVLIKSADSSMTEAEMQPTLRKVDKINQQIADLKEKIRAEHTEPSAKPDPSKFKKEYYTLDKERGEEYFQPDSIEHFGLWLEKTKKDGKIIWLLKGTGMDIYYPYKDRFESIGGKHNRKYSYFEFEQEESPEKALLEVMPYGVKHKENDIIPQWSKLTSQSRFKQGDILERDGYRVEVRGVHWQGWGIGYSIVDLDTGNGEFHSDRSLKDAKLISSLKPRELKPYDPADHDRIMRQAALIHLNWDRKKVPKDYDNPENPMHKYAGWIKSAGVTRDIYVDEAEKVNALQETWDNANVEMRKAQDEGKQELEDELTAKLLDISRQIHNIIKTGYELTEEDLAKSKVEKGKAEFKNIYDQYSKDELRKYRDRKTIEILHKKLVAAKTKAEQKRLAKRIKELEADAKKGIGRYGLNQLKELSQKYDIPYDEAALKKKIKEGKAEIDEELEEIPVEKPAEEPKNDNTDPAIKAEVEKLIAESDFSKMSVKELDDLHLTANRYWDNDKVSWGYKDKRIRILIDGTQNELNKRAYEKVDRLTDDELKALIVENYATDGVIELIHQDKGINEIVNYLKSHGRKDGSININDEEGLTLMLAGVVTKDPDGKKRGDVAFFSRSDVTRHINLTYKDIAKALIEKYAAGKPGAKEKALINVYTQKLIDQMKKDNPEYNAEREKFDRERLPIQAQKLIDAINSKDFKYLLDVLHRGNTTSLWLFKNYTTKPTTNDTVTKESIRSLDPKAYDEFIEEQAKARQKEEEAREKEGHEAKEREKEEARQEVGNSQLIINGIKDTLFNHIERLFKEGYRVRETNEFGGVEWVNDKTNKSLDLSILTKEKRKLIREENRRLMDELIKADEQAEQEEFDKLPQKDKDLINNLFDKQPEAPQKTLKDYGLEVRKTKTNNGNDVWQVPSNDNTKQYVGIFHKLKARWYKPHPKAKGVWSFNYDPVGDLLRELAGFYGETIAPAEAPKTGSDDYLKLLSEVRNRVLNDEELPKYITSGATDEQNMIVEIKDRLKNAVNAVTLEYLGKSSGESINQMHNYFKDADTVAKRYLAKLKENISNSQKPEYNNGKLEAEGSENNEKDNKEGNAKRVPSGPVRGTIQEVSENIPAENVPGTGTSGKSGGTLLPGAGEGKGTVLTDDGEGNGLRPSEGDSTAITEATTGAGGRGQHTGDRNGNVRVTKVSNPKGNDYVINTQGDSIIDNGKKTRYQSNVAAIKLAKQIEAEGRYATPEEQKILAKYVGWGGIPEVFEQDRDYDYATSKWIPKPKKDWEKEYNELKGLLTEEEYNQAHETILNAHYTSIDVIKGMYEGLKHFGFNGGRVLEPAAGIGNFIGSMPTDIRQNVKVMTGIEIDTITGKIAKLLYPNSDIRIQGFENAKLPADYYDVAISNVPFGKIKINDNNYPDTITRAIHNYFFAKTLDVVRPGGIVMFITSNKTMDSKDTSGIRAYISGRADLIGAIRLPNTAFKENAMTEVTTDILILKVREKGTPYSGAAFSELKPKVLQTDYSYNMNAMVNEYFVANPKNVLGELRYGNSNGAYGDVYVKGDGRNLREAVTEAMNKLPSNIYEPAKKKANAFEQTEVNRKLREASRNTKNGSYEVVDGKLAKNKEGTLVEVTDIKHSKEDIDKISRMISIKDTARELLNAQMDNKSESMVKGYRKQLNTLYDSFVKKYGYLNNTNNVKLLYDDPDIDFLKSLENYVKPQRENKKLGIEAVKESATKGDIFTKDTVRPKQVVTSAKNSKEALIVSLNESGTVDVDRMAELVGKSESDVLTDLAGMIYKNPVNGRYETAEEYLSGNVKAKLSEAEAMAEFDPTYSANVEALKAVQPADKEAWQISLKLGSSIINRNVYMKFAEHLFGGRGAVNITQLRHNGMWLVEMDKSTRGSAANRTTWGIDERGFTGYELLEKIMNNKSIIVNYNLEDPATGRKTKINNAEKTALAQEKAERMKTEFLDWLQKDEDGNTLKEVVKYYNDVYNTDVLRKYDGSHLPDTLEGMNPDIKLASHQKDAIWRIISSGGNTLLAHEVGAGKTFEMAAAIMEMLRIGAIRKAMVVVPNNIYEQWGIEFKRLYPASKLLVPTSDDFKAGNRRLLMNKIATGNHDAVIIPESQFKMLPMSQERITEFFMQKMDELREALEIERAESKMEGKKGRSLSEKKITNAIVNLRAKMQKHLDKTRKDKDNVSFEQLGVDSLFVDEAHRFKNLMYTTRLQVSGLGNPDGSDKAFDLLMKVRYLQDLNNGRGIVFATATPLLNSLAEVYNWQQYLAPEQLESMGIQSFDAWASVFSRIESIAEVKPEGTGYRVKNGISKITNVGQLAKLFREFTDVKTQDMLKLPRPEVKGGKYEVISIPGTSWLEAYMQDLAERAEAVRSGNVDPSDDNMLNITTDGRKAALDPRLVDPTFKPDPDEKTKLDESVEHIYKQWNKTKKDRLTHLVFLEFSTPKGEKNVEAEEDTEEITENVELDSLYQDFKRRLVKMGIPANEIAFIHDAKNSVQKINLKNAFNNGNIRILVGNNEKMGVGIDLQKRTKTITHIDFPWRPKDLQQEDGRGLRQGNINSEIEMYVLVTEGSFDARLWDNLQRKSKLVDDILTADIDAIEIDDVGVNTLSAQEVVGIASGNPLMQEQIVVSQQVTKLRALEKAYMQQRQQRQSDIAFAKSGIQRYKDLIEHIKTIKENYEDAKGDNFKVTIAGETFTDHAKADMAISKLKDYYREHVKQSASGSVTLSQVSYAGVVNGVKFKLRSNGSIETSFVDITGENIEAASMVGLALKIDEIIGLEGYYQNLINEKRKYIKETEKVLDEKFPYAEELQKAALREQELMRILNPEQVLAESAVNERDSDDDTDSYSMVGQAAQMPQGNDSSYLGGKEGAKTVDEIVEIIENAIGVPIRTGKYRQHAHGIFKRIPEVIRTMITNDLPTICHELGHYFDKKLTLASNQYDTELIPLGGATSKPSYTKAKIRGEGVAEFVRLYLTNPQEATSKAPTFLAYFESRLNAETINTLNDLRREISNTNNLPPTLKVLNDISTGESRKATKGRTSVIGYFQRMYDAWLNESEPVERAYERAVNDGWAGRNLSAMIQDYRGIEAKVKSNLIYAQTDLDNNVIGPSLSEILKPVRSKKKKQVTNQNTNAILSNIYNSQQYMNIAKIPEYQIFLTYMVSRRAVDYDARGLVMPQPYWVYSDNVTYLEQAFPHFVEVFENLRKWEDNNLQLLVDSEVKSQEETDDMKAANPNHVPLYRIQEAIEKTKAGSGNTLGQSKNVLHRLNKGSGKTIIDPVESMIADAFIIRRAAESNTILKELADIADNIDGFGDIMEKVPPGTKATTLSLEEIKKALEDEGIDTDTIDLDRLVTIFRANYNERPNEITVFRNGKPKLYQMEREIYRAIKGLNRQASHFLIRALNIPKKVIQAGAVTTAQFVIRNVGRDFGTSLINSEAGINPIDIIMGYKSALVKDEWFKKWVRSGAATDYIQISERQQAQEIEDEILHINFIEKLHELIRRPTRENAARLLLTPFNKAHDWVEWSEAGPRVAELKKLIKQGMTAEEAAAWSRDLSQDFKRHGYYGKELNKVTAFFNANLQGIEKMIRVFKEHPFRTVFRGLLYVTVPTLLLYFLNDDNEEYKRMAAWRKALFYNIPLGNPKTTQHFFSWPKPYGWGFLFGALPEIILDEVRHNEPDTWENIKSGFMTNFGVPVVPSVVGPVWEVATNTSWNKVPIENTGDKNKEPYLRFNERTSSASKAIANATKDVVPISPKQLDYLVKGYTGSVGDFFWRLPDTVKKGVQTPDDVTNYPVVKSFITDTLYSNDTVDTFYDYGGKLTNWNNELKETGSIHVIDHLPKSKQGYLKGEFKELRTEYNKLADEIGDLRAEINSVNSSKRLSPSAKKVKARGIQMKIVKAAENYNKKFEKLKEKYKF